MKLPRLSLFWYIKDCSKIHTMLVYNFNFEKNKNMIKMYISSYSTLLEYKILLLQFVHLTSKRSFEVLWFWTFALFDIGLIWSNISFFDASTSRVIWDQAGANEKFWSLAWFLILFFLLILFCSIWILVHYFKAWSMAFNIMRIQTIRRLLVWKLILLTC